jgi:hypothetical protein
MNDLELTRHLFAAKDALLCVHRVEQKRLRRKPHPAELVDAAKAWAQKLLEAVTIYPGPQKHIASFGRMLQRASIVPGDHNGSNRSQRYAPEITAAESLLEIIDHIQDPMRIVMAFKEAFPIQFADVRFLLPFVRVVSRPTGDYLFYRRQDCKPAFEVRLPDDPLSADFMDAYRAAESAYANLNTAPQALAA